MFDDRAFRTWRQVFVGAFVFGSLFFGIVVMAEGVIGARPRLSRAAVALGGAAFFGYVGAAWFVRVVTVSRWERWREKDQNPGSGI